MHIPDSVRNNLANFAGNAAQSVSHGTTNAIEMLRALHHDFQTATPRNITYGEYERLDATRNELTEKGTSQELTKAEIEKLRDAHAKCKAFCAWMFGPDQKPVTYAKVNPTPQKGRRSRKARLYDRY
jgi:hypothetical protein